MKRLEDLLGDKKAEFDNLDIPEEMEERLRMALNKKRKAYRAPTIVAALIIIIIMSYSLDSLAYYGKMLMGYDNILQGSLMKLSAEGRGQEISKSVVFSDGTKVTIDWLVFDKNQLVVLSTIESPNRKLATLHPDYRIAGIKSMGYRFGSFTGSFVDDHIMVSVAHFPPPKFYEKWMSFKIQMPVNGTMEVKTIRFTLNRNLAANQIHESTLDSEVTIGDYKIVFKKITASSLSTGIEGYITGLHGGLTGTEWPNLQFDVVSDNGKIISLRGNQSKSQDKIVFSSIGDALPEGFSFLKIDNIRFESHRLVDKSTNITPSIKDHKISEDIVLRDVQIVDGSTYLTISSRGIPIMALFKDGKQFKTSSYEDYKYEGEQPHPIDRVYKFDGTGENLRLDIKYILYSTYSNESIDIPLQ